MAKQQNQPTAAPRPAATRLADLVAYQPDSVVSRTILKRETGSVTVFAFDRGQQLSEHTAAYDALVHVLEGATDISLSGTPVRLTAGDMIVLPAHAPHAVKAVEHFKMVLTMLKS